MTQPQSEIEAIQKLNDEFAAAMNASDVDAILSLITADIVMMPPGAPPARGTDAVRALFEGMFSRMKLHEVWTSEEIVVEGDLAYDWSSYVTTVTPHGGTSSEVRGQNLYVARRQTDGSWKYSRVMWNSDEAPSGS